MDPDEATKKDKDQNDQSRPGIPRPGQQPDQQQQPEAPPQPASRQTNPSSQWIPPPSTGNPDLDPPGSTGHGRIDLRERNPLTPQGMIYDPRQLLDYQRGQSHPARPDAGLPPGARFDPFGPPDPSQVGPGRGPLPSSNFGIPDPDHLPPPGVPQAQPRMPGAKSLKFPGPQGPRGFGGPGGGGGLGGGGPFI